MVLCIERMITMRKLKLKTEEKEEGREGGRERGREGRSVYWASEIIWTGLCGCRLRRRRGSVNQ